MTNDPKILILTFLSGIIPSFLWLLFWLREDKKKPEPKGVLTIVFIMGMISVICVLPIQKIIQTYIDSSQIELVLWASAEEIIKFLAVFVVIYRTNYIDEPIDWPIYLITGALGFAALENILFLIKPFSAGQNTIAILTSQLRFLGSTLLHTISSGILGIALGLSLYMKTYKILTYKMIGFILATTLHSVFNFFIIKNNGNDFLKVFSFLWVTTIIVMLLFEKLRRMN